STVTSQTLPRSGTALGYGQCGGIGYTGPKNCAWPYVPTILPRLSVYCESVASHALSSLHIIRNVFRTGWDQHQRLRQPHRHDLTQGLLQHISGCCIDTRCSGSSNLCCSYPEYKYISEKVQNSK
ncbi:hypothetical protein BDQ17DRAFT_1543977, partial [Cyathus striatus]